VKKQFRSYTSFTRTERIGLAGLCALLIIFIAVRATMYLWVHPDGNSDKDKKLMAAWGTFNRSQPAATDDTTEKTKKDYQDTFDDNPTHLPDVININTADSATLVRLKGIGPVTAGKIVARRKNKGPYTSISQLSEAGSFSTATFELLKKHLTIK
jgi:DNA uptake protein ComE-like DNA-binding protein